jgi:proteasome lid subunit RPN8/RPN11
LASVAVPYTIARGLKRYLRSAGSNEIGGILLAEQIRPDFFRIVQFTVDETKGTRSTFTRAEHQHSEALDQFHKEKGYEFHKYNYLGEWHSHPSFSVRPSARDRITMQSIVKGSNDIPFAIFRLDYWLRLRASATVFRATHPATEVKLIFEKKVFQR